MAGDAEVPATSDLDVYVVLDDPGEALKPGKFIYDGALLEGSYIAREAVRSPEAVLGSAHLAGGFRTRNIILDPSGELTALQEVVSREFAKRKWVRTRCENAVRGPRSATRSLDESAPLHDQVTGCAFAAGVTTFIPAIAALRNPTVRKRYVASREVLDEYGRLEFQEALLTLLGCAQMGRERVQKHLEWMTAAFDAAAAVRKTPYRFGSDISEAARPISVDGTRELIERGLHREAVFWIVATYGRCRTILEKDGPELLERFDPGYRELMADLGIASFEERMERCRQVEDFVPRVMEVAEAIMAANAEIED